jgi:hypothetical protein
MNNGYTTQDSEIAAFSSRLPAIWRVEVSDVDF